VEHDSVAAAEVKADTKRLADAYGEYSERKRAQAKRDAAMTQLREQRPDLAEQVGDDRMTLNDALMIVKDDLAKAQVAEREENAANERLHGYIAGALDQLAGAAEINGGGPDAVEKAAAHLADRLPHRKSKDITPERLRLAAAVALRFADLLDAS
jgi:hypothetical protein